MKPSIGLLISALIFCQLSSAKTASPLWTFTPLTATTLAVPVNTTATIQYLITNQSQKSHTLAMLPIAGIQQKTTLGNCANPFTLAYQQSCTLTLEITGNALPADVLGGPKVCQQGNVLQCYQPSVANSLNITRITASNAMLTSNVATLALATSGNARTILLTNTSQTPAFDVAYSVSPALPAGSIISPATCGTIAPSDTCTLTITPGATPSAMPGDTAPTPIALSIAGSNTNTLTPTLNILTFGSVYQSGYLYAIDDTTPTMSSIGGKVVSLADQTGPSGILWSADNSGNYDGGAIIYGISETSTTLSPNPNSGQISGQMACNGGEDGACNTNNIIQYYTPPTTNPPINFTDYAAGICKQTLNGYSDWYLPAACEMGTGAGCGTMANIVDNLPDLIGDPNAGTPSTSCTYGANCLVGYYWSSTEFSSAPQFLAWNEYFASGGGSFQLTVGKDSALGVRCSRLLTL